MEVGGRVEVERWRGALGGGFPDLVTDGDVATVGNVSALDGASSSLNIPNSYSIAVVIMIRWSAKWR
jgi:hypothetical protein